LDKKTRNFLCSDRIEDECGIFGGNLENNPQGVYLGLYALYALQHRGQESAGIAISGNNGIKVKKGLGLVSEVFQDLDPLEDFKGDLVAGHVRYSYGEQGKRPENTQPLLLRYQYGEIAVSHNGNLINNHELRKELESQGSIFQTTTDSELLAHLVAREGTPDLIESLKKILPRLKGGFAFVILANNQVIGIRDPLGNRPLSLGKLENNQYVLASETCAFDTIGAEFVRHIEPGEMISITREGINSIPYAPAGSALCVFEFIYFARPDSNLCGRNVHLVRKELGKILSKELPVTADFVTGVPDSSISAASGFGEAAGLPYEMGLIKNRYIGRTFIQPSEETRKLGVKLKLNPVRKIVEGKKVVIIDDSIVRGTTTIRLVKMLRDVGASEVHVRISSPPVVSPCYYGINIPTQEELIAYHKSEEEVCRYIGADSLKYLSTDNIVKAVGLKSQDLCLACFTGNYPY